MQKKNTTVAILAGGHSSRFGSDKAEAAFNGKTLLSNALDIAAQISENIIIISNNNYEGYNNIFADVYTDRGPLGAIHAALKNSKTKMVALLPVDMPLMIPAVYKVLYKNVLFEKPVVAVSESGLEPLVSIWQTGSLKVIEKRLEENINSPLDALGELNYLKINIKYFIPDFRQEIFSNINTQDDLTRLEELSINM